REGQRCADQREQGEEQERVHAEREVGQDAAEPVVQPHKDADEHDGDVACAEALVDGVSSQQRAARPVLHTPHRKGGAPPRSSTERSRADSNVNPPSITPWPPGIGLLITGELITRLSSAIVRYFP